MNWEADQLTDQKHCLCQWCSLTNTGTSYWAPPGESYLGPETKTICVQDNPGPDTFPVISSKKVTKRSLVQITAVSVTVNLQ